MTTSRLATVEREQFDVLQSLYALHEARGVDSSSNSNELARRCGMDPEVVEHVAVALHKRNLVTFDACDEGLLNLRLTAEGIEQMGNSPA